MLIVPLLGQGCLDRLQGSKDKLEKTGSAALADSIEERARTSCIKTCQEYQRLYPEELSMGPCIEENLLRDWVCDVAHNPRTDVDDDPANQCANFRNGNASHFVEVDEDCNVIRVR